WNGKREGDRLARAGELQRLDERRRPGVGLGLHPGKAEEATHDVAKVLGGLIIARFGAKAALQPAIDVPGGGEPFDRGETQGNLLGEVRLGSEHVEAANGPGVVACAD